MTTATKTTVNVRKYCGDTEYVLTFPISEMQNAIALCGWMIANSIRQHGGSEAIAELERIEAKVAANDWIPIPDGREWFQKFARKVA